MFQKLQKRILGVRLWVGIILFLLGPAGWIIFLLVALYYRSQPASAPLIATSIELVIGGYYTMREHGREHYSVLRVLNVDDQTIHCTPYAEHFASPPSEDRVLSLKPAILHIPLNARAAAAWRDTTLVANPRLTHTALEGYQAYLEYTLGVSPKEAADHIAALIGESGKSLVLTFPITD